MYNAYLYAGDVLSIIKEKQEIFDKSILKLQYDTLQSVKPLYKYRNNILKTIPEFWCKTLRSHIMLEPYLNDVDTIYAMNYCTNIFSEPLPLPLKGFRLTFV